MNHHIDSENYLQTLLKNGQLISYTHKGGNNILLDKKIFRHIIFNLVANAIKFSDEDQTIEIYSELNTNNAQFIVKDKGIGISEEDQKHLFERFFRAHNATNIQGTGLGLNIVKKYTDLLNGQIDLESKLNEGTTFIVNIPSLILT